MTGTGAVRDRNESAWLLPAGPGTPARAPRGHAALRRRGRGRPGRRRVRRRRFDAAAARSPGPAGERSRWTPGRSGTPRPTGSATRRARTTSTGPNPGSSAGTTRCRWAPTTPAGGSAGRWSTTPATPHGSTPATSAPGARTASARTGPSRTTTCGPTTPTSRRSCPSPDRTGRGATRTRYPHRPHPVGGNGEVFLRGAAALGIPARVGPVAIANGRFGNRPHCIYRGFCLQGCKVNAKASPLITHIPDALAHGAEVRADSMVTRVEVDDRTGLATGVHYVHRGVQRFQRARMVAIAGYSIETRGCCSPRRRAGSRTGCATTSTRSAATSWSRAPRRPQAGSTPRSACTRRRHRRSAASTSTRPTRRSPTSAASRSRPSRPCPSPGPSTSPPRATGAARCGST